MILFDSIDEAECELWQAPSLGAGRPPDLDQLHQQWQQQLEQQKKQSFEEGVRQGYEQGMASADAEKLQEKTQLVALLNEFAPVLGKHQRQTRDELHQLVFAIARQIVARELVNDAEYYQNRIEQLCDAYADGKSVRIRLSVEDHALLDNEQTDGLMQGLDLVADDTLSRGSCLLESEQFFVDGGVDTLLQQLAKTVDLHEQPIQQDDD